MKHCVPVPAFTLFLFASALVFVSCASHPIKCSEPSVSILKSEPASNPLPPVLTAAHTASSSPSHDTAKMIAITKNFTSSGENILALLLLLLALLLLWASIRQLRGNKKIPPTSKIITPQRTLTSSREPIHKSISITNIGTTHLLHAKNNYHPIVPANLKDDIMVSAYCYDQMRKMHFAPNTTFKKIAGWAAYQYEISDEYLQEVYLTIRNHFSPLRATAHLAHFVPKHKKHLELDVKIWVTMRV